jgi:hypothetical protein
LAKKYKSLEIKRVKEKKEGRRLKERKREILWK